jgi:hypothetical protein
MPAKGQHSLCCEYDISVRGNAACFATESVPDLSGYTAIAFAIYSLVSHARVAFAFSTGGSYVWHETRDQPLQKGWIEVTLDLDAKTFKTEASGWEHTAPLDDKANVRRIDVIFWPGQVGPGAMYLDDIRLK